MSQTAFLHSVSVIRIHMQLIQILPLLWSYTELWSLVKDLEFFIRFPCMYCLPYAVSMPNNRPIHHLLAMMLLKHLFSHKLSVRLTERKISQCISCPYLQIKILVFADSWRICGEMYLCLRHLFIIASRTRALHGWMLFHSDIIWESTKLLTLFAYRCLYDVNLEFILNCICFTLEVWQANIYCLQILSSFSSAMHKPSSLRVSLDNWFLRVLK